MIHSPSRPRNAWSVFDIAHAKEPAVTTRHDAAQDTRPLWQRLDDEEDRQLIRQRRVMHGYRVAGVLIMIAIAFAWFVGG
jgi:hypothetical protein